MYNNGMAVLSKQGDTYSLEAVDLSFDFSNRGVFSDIREALGAYAKEMGRGVSLSLGIGITDSDRKVYDGFRNNLQPTS
ncbi:MAG: hypothetical protein HY831_00620 [Candidatus Aenigmarchaeota archaeon]|nr:hypothetical protein [Candidatus Aenigmarchaeota archaeon]